MYDQYRKNFLLERIAFYAEKFFANNATDISRLLDYGMFCSYQGGLDEIMYEQYEDEDIRRINRRLWKIQWAMENELIGCEPHYHYPEQE